MTSVLHITAHVLQRPIRKRAPITAQPPRKSPSTFATNAPRKPGARGPLVIWPRGTEGSVMCAESSKCWPTWATGTGLTNNPVECGTNQLGSSMINCKVTTNEFGEVILTFPDGSRIELRTDKDIRDFVEACHLRPGPSPSEIRTITTCPDRYFERNNDGFRLASWQYAVGCGETLLGHKAWSKQQRDPALRHEGCECASCGNCIRTESDGESSPEGSMHTHCAKRHQQQYPDQW
jgi:hypothetical protein